MDDNLQSNGQSQVDNLESYGHSQVANLSSDRRSQVAHVASNGSSQPTTNTMSKPITLTNIMSHPKTELRLVGIALGWLFLQLIIPQPVRLYATVMVIAVIFIVSIYRLIKHGRIMIWMNLCQPFLFITLYMQIYSYYGAQNYAFPTQDYVPSLTDWFEFTFVHILRASDILDIIEEYNIRLQTIQHNTNGVAWVIMAMHWMVDIFLVSMVFKLLAVPIQNLWNKIETKLQILITATFTISILLAIPITSLIVSCAWKDWFLWPLDNIIRVADVGDSFQLFQITLHSLPRGGWNFILSLLFRILVALYLAYFGQKIRLSVIGGIGMTIQDLIENIEHSSNIKIRISAIKRLGKIGPEAREAIPTLVVALKDWDSDVRTAVAYALGKIGPAAILDLVKATADNSSDLRSWAAKALGNIGPVASPAIPDLVKALADKNSHVRTAAAKALGNIGPAASPAIPDLVKALADRDSDVRTAAAKALGNIGSAASPAIPDLVKALADRDSDVRTAAAYALGKINLNWRTLPAVQYAIPDLVKALETWNKDVRTVVANALGNIGPAASPAVPTLVKALKDWNFYVRTAAAKALGNIGSAASPAIPDLVKALAGWDSDVRTAAANALKKINPNWHTLLAVQSAIPDLVKALITGKSDIRTTAAYALDRIGPITIPELIRGLENDKSPEARTAIAEVLTRMGKSAVPDLAKALKHKFSYVRRTIAEVLGNIGPEARFAIPELTTALQDQNSYVRLAVVEALGKIGPLASSAIPELTNLVSEGDVHIVESATKALAKIKST